MDVDVVNFEKRVCKKKVGCVLVRYGELLMKCDLVYNPKYFKAWVRMPEIWLKDDKKVHYCYWPTKEKSDEFQNEILKKIFDKYNLSLEKVKDLHLEGIQKRGNSKKCGQN